jgi:glucose-6-phosphate isomerase, archaeal
MLENEHHRLLLSGSVMEESRNSQVVLKESRIVPDSTPIRLDWLAGGLDGLPAKESVKKLADLEPLFQNRAAFQAMDPQMEIYRVRSWMPVPAGSQGGLFWGVTILQPGKVGEEYFMTHGHFHANRTRAEYYCGVKGEGLLIRMDEHRSTSAETMEPGTLHYIRGEHAHRVVNVGSAPLIFWACWCSDAGYNYGAIRERGFGARVVEREGRPVIVSHE